MKPDERSPSIDGMRGVAILLVLFWHMYACLPRPGWVCGIPVIEWVANRGWSGVHLFFVLSGFLLGRILLRHLGASGYYRAFYLRRAARILPLYCLCLFGYLVVSAIPTMARSAELAPLLDNRPLPFWSYPLFVQNIAMAQGGIGCHWLGVTWSLAIEEQFYILLPLLLALIPRRHVLLAALALIAGPPLLRFIVLTTEMMHPAGATLLLPTRIDGFGFGLLVAELLETRSMISIRAFRWPIFLGAILAFAAVEIARPQAHGSTRLALFAITDGSFYAVYASALVFVLSGMPGRSVASILGAGPLVWVGNTSYFIYLFHQPAQYLSHWALRQSAPSLTTLSAVGCTMFALGALGIVAELSRRFVEHPSIRLGHRWGTWNR